MKDALDASTVLRRRIRANGFSQTSFALEVGRRQSWVSNNLLGDPGGTLNYLAYRDPETLKRVLYALRWSLTKLNEETGLSIPIGPDFSSGHLWDNVADEDLDRSGWREVPPGVAIVPVLGVANGGRPHEYETAVEERYVRGTNTRAYLVKGNSMAVGDRGIHDGDLILIDVSLSDPVELRVYLLEIHGDGMTVKRLRRFEDEWRFTSDNPEVGESWREDQVTIIGQVYGKVLYEDVR